MQMFPCFFTVVLLAIFAICLDANCGQDMKSLTVQEKIPSWLKDFNPKIPDWYYPACELQQRANLQIPACLEINNSVVTLKNPATGKTVSLKIGQIFDGWQLVEILTLPKLMAVLEYNFADWGLFAYINETGLVAEIRKAVGRIDMIKEPKVVYPENYFKTIIPAMDDLLGLKVLAEDPDPSYESVLGYLGPIQSHSFVGIPSTPDKVLIMANGSVGWQPEFITPNMLYTQPNPIYFAPEMITSDTKPTDIKRGRLGGFLPAVDFGFFNSNTGIGFEEIVFAVEGTEEGKPKIYVRLRLQTGEMSYYRVNTLYKLESGKDFYMDLLALHHKWAVFFNGAMQLDIPEKRVIDTCYNSILQPLIGSVGLRPTYGMLEYWKPLSHGAFPPITISFCRCLLDWGLHEEAKSRLGYYLSHFVKDDGTFDYYGPAVSEYGQMLELTVICSRQTGDWQWFKNYLKPIDKMADWLMEQRQTSKQLNPRGSLKYGLISGSPEADTHEYVDYYFSGNVWAWRGLFELGKFYKELAEKQNDEALQRRAANILNECELYQADILYAAEKSVIDSKPMPFFSPIVGYDKEPFRYMPDNTLPAYTNYRYWLESMSAQCLGGPYEQMMMNYRRTHGGEILGTTHLFPGRLDDWPFYNSAYWMIANDDIRHYLLAYYSHMAHHQMRGTFTAYEQVPVQGIWSERNYHGIWKELGLPGIESREYAAAYCVPAQMIIPLMTRWMLVFEERDRDVLWLCKAVPRKWFESRVGVSDASTRWGPVSFNITGDESKTKFVADITFIDKRPLQLRIRVRHPQLKQLVSCKVLKGTVAKAACVVDYVEVDRPSDRLIVELTFGK